MVIPLECKSRETVTSHYIVYAAATRPKGDEATMTTQYLSYGIVDGRTHTDQEIALLRTVELDREHRRRERRTRRFFSR